MASSAGPSFPKKMPCADEKWLVEETKVAFDIVNVGSYTSYYVSYRGQAGKNKKNWSSTLGENGINEPPQKTAQKLGIKEVIYTLWDLLLLSFLILHLLLFCFTFSKKM